jgi:competence protein ComEC
LAAHPLIPAAALFLLGVACGRFFADFGSAVLVAAVAAWLVWLAAELRPHRTLAHGALAALLLLTGAGLWIMNQEQVERQHVVRFLPAGRESAAMLRATVLAVSDAQTAYGNRFWIAQARQIWTEGGWAPAAGDVMVQSVPGMPLPPGTQVELYGWLSRPPGALNPGAFDPKATLAADRVFVQMRVPRESGVVVLDTSAAQDAPLLARMRAYLRGKLLAHLIQEDVPAAQTLTALLLGHRDPAIADVSQSFADAGVAHLLAISGSHIVFFTGLVWAVLRFIPLRPRWREMLIAAVVGLYVLATPCGPPIMRAAVALALVVLARLLGRPRAYLNMLAAAAVVVVILRPMDLFNAGFQLSFVTTAGLILFSQRVHTALFGRWLERLALVAELSRRRLARWRLRTARVLAAVLTANLIGATTAAPLVAYHFGQVNLWAALAGLLALPIVSAAMVVAAVQLLLELAGAGAFLSPLAALVGRAMIWLVGLLADLPGAALPLRAPPVWLIVCLYGAILLWTLRRRLGVSRALVVNACVAAAALAAGWYALSIPAGQARLVVCSAGDGCCMLLRTPQGELWCLDAGSAQGTSVLRQALVPALRVEGSRRLDGQIVTALDAAHAGSAAAALDACRPPQVWASAPWWETHGQTLAGWQLAASAKGHAIPVNTLRAGDVLALGGCRVNVLWPPADGNNVGRRDLILLCEIAGHRVLFADPASAGALALLPAVHCDAVVFTGPQRGAADVAVRKVIAGDGVPTIIWCGRGPWASGKSAEGEWNTAEGAVALDFAQDVMRVTRAAE